MFSAPTRRAMLALAAGDLEGTQADRDAFARFLGSMCGGPSVLTKKAVPTPHSSTATVCSVAPSVLHMKVASVCPSSYAGPER